MSREGGEEKRSAAVNNNKGEEEEERWLLISLVGSSKSKERKCSRMRASTATTMISISSSFALSFASVLITSAAKIWVALISFAPFLGGWGGGRKPAVPLSITARGYFWVFLPLSFLFFSGVESTTQRTANFHVVGGVSGVPTPLVGRRKEGRKISLRRGVA